MSKAKEFIKFLKEDKDNPVDNEELQLYMDNTREIYYTYYIPTVKGLLKFLDAGTYNINQAARVFMRMIDFGIKSYKREFSDAYFKVDKQALAVEYATDTLNKYKTSELDYLRK